MRFYSNQSMSRCEVHEQARPGGLLQGLEVVLAKMPFHS